MKLPYDWGNSRSILPAMDPYGAFLWYQGFDEKPSTIIPLVCQAVDICWHRSSGFSTHVRCHGSRQWHRARQHLTWRKSAVCAMATRFMDVVFFFNLLCCISATPSRFTWFTITYIPIPSLHLSRWIRHAFGRPWCEKSARLVVDSRGDWSGLSRDLRTWRAHITGISTSQARIALGAHCHWGHLTVFIGIGAGRGPWIKSYQPFLSAFFSTPSTNMTTWKMAQSKYIEMLDLPSFQMVIFHDFPAISLVHQRPSNSPNTFFVCCVEAHDTLLVVLGRGSSV